MSARRSYLIDLADGSRTVVDRPQRSSYDLDLRGFVSDVREGGGVLVDGSFVPWHAITRITLLDVTKS